MMRFSVYCTYLLHMYRRAVAGPLVLSLGLGAGILVLMGSLYTRFGCCAQVQKFLYI